MWICVSTSILLIGPCLIAKFGPTLLETLNVCVCTCAYMHVCVRVHVSVCDCVCVCVCLYVSVCVCAVILCTVPEDRTLLKIGYLLIFAKKAIEWVYQCW